MKPTLEHLLIAELFNDNLNNSYFLNCVTSLKPEFFTKNTTLGLILHKTQEYFDAQNEKPSVEVLRVECEGEKISKDKREELNVNFTLIEQILDKQPKFTDEWLSSKTQDFIREKASYLVLLEAVEKHSGELTELSGIPEKLEDALSFTLEKPELYDLINDPERLWRDPDDQTERVPFKTELMNDMTGGGPKKRQLVVPVAGCVHPNTMINVKLFPRAHGTSASNSMIDYESKLFTMHHASTSVSKKSSIAASAIPISDVQELLKTHHVEVDSPDGFVPVTNFVDKGEWTEYCLVDTENPDNFCRCNENHLFETDAGWQYAKDMDEHTTHVVLTKDGFHECVITKTSSKIPIVDITVGHRNQRYYTNGISSHNTGAGKTLFMVDWGNHLIQQGYNVLFITMEMAPDEIAYRQLANFKRASVSSCEALNKKDFVQEVKTLREGKMTGCGKFIIEHRGTLTVSPRSVKKLLNDTRVIHGVSFDIVMIDYLNTMISNTGAAADNLYQNGKQIAMEVKALAQAEDILIVCPAQLSRAGHSSSDPTLIDIGESHAISQQADFVFSLVSTDELRNTNRLVVKQLKSRLGDMTKIPSGQIQCIRESMLTSDLPDGATPASFESQLATIIDTEDELMDVPDDFEFTS